MPSTLLSLVRAFSQRVGLPTPSSVAGSLDHQVVQIHSLLNQALEDLCTRWDWQDLQYEATFTTLTGEDQGAITTIAPNGFQRIFNETIFNRTLRLPLFGPMRKEQWQALKALPTAGPFYKFRVLRGRLLFNPAGVAGQTCAFEYQSDWAVYPSGQSSPAAAAFLADGDTSIFPDKLLLAALEYLWLKRKGLDYAEEFLRFERLGNDLAGRDVPKGRIDLAGSSDRMIPGIWVSPGNWPVT